MTDPLPDLERVYFWAFHAAEIAADEYDGDAFHRAALLAVYRAGQKAGAAVCERMAAEASARNANLCAAVLLMAADEMTRQPLPETSEGER